MNPRVKRVEAKADYCLEITFSNGEVGTYDCRPLLQFGVFQELQDEAYFRQVRAAGGTVVWPHEQDICPDTLYLDSERRPRQGPSTQRRKRPTSHRRQGLAFSNERLATSGGPSEAALMVEKGPESMGHQLC